MSKKKATKKASNVSVNHERLTALHRIGVLKDIDARKPLTDAQRKRVASTFGKLHQVANAPKGEYVRQSIKGYLKSDVDQMRKSGIVIHGETAYLSKQGYNSAHLKETYKRGSDGVKRRTVEVVRKIGDKKIERELIAGSISKLEFRDRLLAEYAQGKFGPNDFIGIKAFDGSMFNRAILSNMNQVFAYENQMIYHNDRELVRDNLHLVRITVKDLADMDADQKTEKQKEKAKYQRRKQSRKTKPKQLSGRKKPQ